VKRLRTASTRTLIAFAVGLVTLAVLGTAIAVASSSGGTPPPPKPLAEALHDAATAPEPAGITARVTFTNNLFPSGALSAGTTSPLMSGGSGRLWVTNDGRGRLEIQSDAGDAQVVWNDTTVTVYDASTNTAYKATLPAHTSAQDAQKTPPTLTEIEDFLTQLSQNANVSDAQPGTDAGQGSYTVTVSPKHDGGLLGQAQLAWDAAQGVPLRIAVYAAGSSTPALELKVTEISYGPVAASDVNIAPPADAKVTDLTGSGSGTGSGSDQPAVTGLPAVQAAAGFTVVAPDTLVGLPRQDVRLVGSADSKHVLVSYGQGLGGILVVESATAPDAKPADKTGAGLPTVAIDGVTGQELPTQLGTAILWQRSGVDFVLAGSVPAAAAEAAARALQ
jgi:outer membrane lipoprotein-sorting protein